MAMVKKELIVITRYPVNFIASFAQIFFIVAIFTFAGLAFSSDETGTQMISGIVVYGFVLFIFISDTLWTIGYNVRQEQVQGTLEQLYLSPASKFMSLVSRVTNLLVWTGLLVVASGWFMKALIGELPFNNVGLAAFLLLMNLFAIFGMGFAFAAITLRLKQTAETLANLLQFFFMIFSAMFFPFSALPKVILFISRLIPFSYGVDIFRSTLMGYPTGFPELAPIQTEIWITTIFGLAMPFLGFWLYKREEKRARQEGSLSSY
jgi:ABC-2 type transport system permease protein